MNSWDWCCVMERCLIWREEYQQKTTIESTWQAISDLMTQSQARSTCPTEKSPFSWSLHNKLANSRKIKRMTNSPTPQRSPKQAPVEFQKKWKPKAKVNRIIIQLIETSKKCNDTLYVHLGVIKIIKGLLPYV